MTEESANEMLQSMLELTTEDEWDDLTAASRLELVKMKLNSSGDLSEEQVRWLIDEQDRAIADLKETMQNMFVALEEHVKPYLVAIAESMQPLAELAGENNAE